MAYPGTLNFNFSVAILRYSVRTEVAWHLNTISLNRRDCRLKKYAVCLCVCVCVCETENLNLETRRSAVLFKKLSTSIYSNYNKNYKWQILLNKIHEIVILPLINKTYINIGILQIVIYPIKYIFFNLKHARFCHTGHHIRKF